MIPPKAVSGEITLIELKPVIIPPFVLHLTVSWPNTCRANTSRRSRRRSRRRRRRSPRLRWPDLARSCPILPARILASGAVLILAAVTTPVRVRSEGNRRRYAEDSGAAERGDGHEGRGKAPAMKVNRLFATAGVGEVLPLNSACCCAMKMPDAAYDLQ